ncbi:MAG: CcmD family protein [Dehalococcoidales bacterium]|nr:CcmD family protein [Dehalococcoidales bacterium]
MENGGYLLAAFVTVWAVVFIYVLFLSARQAKLKKEIEALKLGLKEKTIK